MGWFRNVLETFSIRGKSVEHDNRLRPFEQIAIDVNEGRITPEAGGSQTAELVSSGSLPPEELVKWFSTAVWVGRQEDLWERALLLSDLLCAALDAASDTVLPEDVARGHSDRVEVAHLALVHRPDARLYHDAMRRGESALAWATEHADSPLRGEVLYRLGTLNLDPFSRTPEAWWDEHRLWLSLAEDEYSAHGLPEPLDALALGEDYLRRSMEFRTGAALGYTRKALHQALLQQRFHGVPTDASEIVRLARTASREIPADDVESLIHLDAPVRAVERHSS